MKMGKDMQLKMIRPSKIKESYYNVYYLLKPKLKLSEFKLGEQSLDELYDYLDKKEKYGWHFIEDGEYPDDIEGLHGNEYFEVIIADEYDPSRRQILQYGEGEFGWYEDIYDKYTFGFVDSEWYKVEDVVAWRLCQEWEEIKNDR